MRWYEYRITLEPGQRMVNTVTAPLYPSIDLLYEPPVYQYTYLLSPAQSWDRFGTLDVEIRTPDYLTESGLEGFTSTDGGVYMPLDRAAGGGADLYPLFGTGAGCAGPRDIRLAGVDGGGDAGAGGSGGHLPCAENKAAAIAGGNFKASNIRIYR